MFARLRLALAATTLLAAATIATAPATSLAGPAPVDPKEVTDAARFRAEVGFDSAAGFVANTFSDTSAFPNRRYGVPLSLAEGAELARREAVIDFMAGATEFARTQPGYAGEYFDHHAGGIPVYLFTDSLDENRAALTSRFPASAKLDVRLVRYSFDELLAKQVKLDLATDSLDNQGIRVVSTGLDVAANSVLVGIEGSSEQVESDLQASFGPGLTFREQGPAIADACVSIKNCWPPKGGIEIKSNATGEFCTSGFIVRRLDTQALVMVTAGHCIETQGGAGTVWSHNGSNIGQRQNETWAANADADVGLIGIYTSSTPAAKNQVITAEPNTVGSITIAPANFTQSVGQMVCRTGRTWGVDCGTIVVVNVTRQSCVGATCKSILHTWEVSFDSTGGDSGGPIIRNGSSAYGTHIHSDPDGPGAHGWYSPTDWGRTAYNGMFGVQYVICNSAAC